MSIHARSRSARKSASYFGFAVTTTSLLVLLGSTAAIGAEDTTQVPAEILVDDYNNEGPVGIFAVADAIVRVYRDSIPWFGENRDVATLESLGKVIGTDLFIHPLTDLSVGIPAGTDVVLISSNGGGFSSAATNQTASAAQAALDAFVQGGGVLIVDMADNLGSGGFVAPGAVGTPDNVRPFPCTDATITPDAKGPDGMIGTPDDHPVVKGPDGVAGTADDWNDSNIDSVNFCYIAHGNLEQGITLPADATHLITSIFSGTPQTILAEYELGGGLVILDTLTKEHSAQNPSGNGPSVFMRNLFAYAMADRVPVYACVGFEPPMGNGAVSVQKKRALPHKAVIVDADDFEITPAEISAAPVIQVVFTGNAVPAEDVSSDALSAGQGTAGNQFVFTDELKWQFNLKTDNYTQKGTYDVTMISGDPTEYVIDPTCEASFVLR